VVPDGYLESANDCQLVFVLPGANPLPSCTFTNRPTESQLVVDKTFSDGNDLLEVPVEALCTNGALIVATDPTPPFVTHTSDAVFTLRYFTPGATCMATEGLVPGYVRETTDDDCASPQAIAHLTGNRCELLNVHELEALQFIDGFELCMAGAVEACYPGPPGTFGVGQCIAGTRTCGEDGHWQACSGWIGPEAEDCLDENDNDCDGEVNEDCDFCDPLSSTLSCGIGQGCYIGECNGSNCAAQCESEGFGGEDSACSVNTDCQSGYQCWNTGSENVCREACPPGAIGNLLCGLTSNCVSTGIFVDGEEIGYCD
ncbi:MAG: hypothetical protein R3330_13830, partial [Saprospiraceae bacterium]|nr:hypothetical protein [Saprospiraceae bacterium]